ncbi:MAG: arylamine N-acetyltransferase, partial [Clostridiales bacterium]|nr:arylamine N-acetyltransferase [Clostridiales bacterium]
MAEEMFSLNDYFDRIGFRGKADVSFETLNALHTAHTLNIPFENLDVYYKRPLLLDKESLFKKIVTGKRGGYCFEMNGLFSFVLREIGFKVTDLLAGGRLHQILMVEIGDDRYLADVGFGNDGITSPLLLVEGLEQKQFTNTYRFGAEPKFDFALQRKAGDEFITMYAFTLQECSPLDFMISNHFTATYPKSFFNSMRMCTMPTKEGRITLTDKHFKVVENGETVETAIADDEEFNT